MQHDLNVYLESVEEVDRLTLTRAIQFLHEYDEAVIHGPVSLLQRRLRIGYSQCLRILHHLEQLQILTIREDAEHRRVAIVEPH